MGMYTELVLKCEVKDALPDEVRTMLNFLFNGGEIPIGLPEHPFFKCARWSMIGTCSSYYHVPFALSRFLEGHIFSRSDLKNYDNEIGLFLNWLHPYIDAFEGDCIGWKWYEEYRVPTLLIYTNVGVLPLDK